MYNTPVESEQGRILKLTVFKDYCERGLFVDNGGFANPVRFDMVDTSIDLNPSDWLDYLPKDATHVIWFNR